MKCPGALRITVVAAVALGLAGCETASSRDRDLGRTTALDPTGLAALAAVSLSAFGVAEVPAAGKHAPATAGSGERWLGPAVEAAHGFTVLSFNMQHRDRPGQLALMAEQLSSDLPRLPDLILCQEVLFKRSASKGRDNTAAVLADELGYFVEGTKRTSDREGVAIVSRWPFAYYDAKHLRARTSALLLGFRRVSVMGEFLVPGVGRVRVVNVHFAYLGFEGRIRRKQLAETLEWIDRRDRQVPADVIILGGDFNSRPHGKEFEPLSDPAITGDLRYRSWNTSEPTRGPKGRPDTRVDYIFVSAPSHDVRMLREQLLFKQGLRNTDGGGRAWLSDHVALLHEYAVAPRPALVASPDSPPAYAR